MPPCVVLGGSGAVGRFLLPRLRAVGHEVIALSRMARTSDDPGMTWLVGDLDARMPPLPPCTALFSLGPLDAFAHWFQRAPELIAPQIVAFGSMSIETKADSTDSAERALAQRLREAERGVLEMALGRGGSLTILRPTLIYGAGVDRSLTPIARFARRWGVFPQPIGARGLRQPVHADDLAAACVALLANPRAGARTYAVGGGERLPFSEMLKRVKDGLPSRCLAIPIPLVAARYLVGAAHTIGLPVAGAAAIERLNVDLVADHSAAMADFGWSPRPFHPRPSDWFAD